MLKNFIKLLKIIVITVKHIIMNFAINLFCYIFLLFHQFFHMIVTKSIYILIYIKEHYDVTTCLIWHRTIFTLNTANTGINSRKFLYVIRCIWYKALSNWSCDSRTLRISKKAAGNLPNGTTNVLLQACPTFQ